MTLVPTKGWCSLFSQIFLRVVTKGVTRLMFNAWSWRRMLAKNDSEGLSGKHGQGYDD